MRYFLCAALIFWAVTASASAPHLKSFVGDVKVKQSGEHRWNEAVTGMPLRNGDRIKTMKASRAIISVSESTITVEPDSSIEITIDLIDDKPSGFISMMHGRVSLVIDRLRKTERYGVRTPATIAAIRGTEFEVAAGPDGTTLVQVNKGTVTVAGIEREVKVGANRQTSVQVGHDPSDVQIIKRQVWDEWFAESEKNARENAPDILKGCLARAEQLDRDIKAMQVEREKLLEKRDEYSKLVEEYREKEDIEKAREYRRLQHQNHRGAYSLNAKTYYQASRIALVKELADTIFEGAEDKENLEETYKKIDEIYQVYYTQYIKEIEDERKEGRR